ncbi:MAG: UvrD-helicase domain-containing protein [Acidaminococcales bacterium]|jgi:ATP-dependent helicase/nuclease subunit A|nr:UvrD-helicase domain-containing protein [Acidaminococcales bacterium]
MQEYTPEQEKAINSINVNTAVVAGAGSGKTRALVERYLGLVSGGVDCRRILAITFTEKAAAEMAGRIRAEMAGRAEGDARTNGTAGEANWRKQKEFLPRAYIGTIHGLCAGIIRANPMAAGVDPDVKILDESRGRLIAAEAARNAFARLLPDSAAFAALCEEYGYYRLLQYVKSIMDKFTFAETADAGFPDRLAAGCHGARGRLGAAKRDFLAALLELLAGADGLKASKTSAALTEISDSLETVKKALVSLPDDQGALRFVDGLVGKLRKQSKAKLLIEGVKAAWENVVGGCRDCRALDIMPCWARIINSCAGELALQKKRLGALTFSDLESLALKILKNDKVLRGKYMDKYRHIMIDEFQDTNRAQKEIAYLLAGGDAEILHGNKLFIVGDERQSIYRFRGADVSVFAQARQDILSGGGSQIELLDNFRSRAEIIAVCNHLFSSPVPGLENMKYKPMRAGRAQEKAAGEPTEILASTEAAKFLASAETAPLQASGETTDGGHAAEAAAIAQRLCLLRDEGFTFADMAILLRARTHLAAYTEALEAAGVPYSLLDGQGFFKAAEITDMLNLLRFLDNSLRDLPLLGLLRAPFFGLDDCAITLLALSAGEGSFWQKLKNFPCANLSSGQRQLAERAAAILENLLRAARILSIGPLLRAVIEELRLLPLFLSYPDGRQKYANVEKFVDMAFAFEQDANGGLGEFIAYIDGLLDIEAREGLAQLEDEGSDAVKLLTIHKAKGLEFKAVVLADCGAAFPADRSSFFYGEEYGLGIKVRCGGKLQPTGCFDKARESGKNKNLQEARRLLYVAMTRARDKLIISADKVKNPSWLQWIKSSFENEGDGFLRGGEAKIRLWENAVMPTVCGKEGEIKEGAQIIASASVQKDFAKLLRQTRPINWQSQNRLSFSATALHDYRHCQKLFYYKYIAALPEQQPSGRNGETARPGGLSARTEGLIAHSVLAELGEYTFPEALDRACAKHLGAGGGAERDNIAQWLSLYINHPLWREAAARETMREVGFRLPLLTGSGGPLWFSGSIDSLSFDGNDGLWLTDYKTDREFAGKAEKYAPQMMVYALAAEMLYPGRKTAKAQLHFIRERTSVEVDITNGRSRLIEAIRELCGEITGKTKEDDFAAASGWCGLCGYNWVCAGEK